MPSARLHTTVTIRRSPEGVFAFLMDAANNARWQDGVIACDQDGPAAVGTRVHETRELLGVRLQLCYELVEIDWPRRAVVHAIEGPVALRATYELAPRGGATVLTVTGEAERPCLPALAGPLGRALARRELGTSCAALKRVLEAGGEAWHRPPLETTAATAA